MDLRCDLDILPLSEHIYGHQTRVNKTVNLYSYLRICGNIMCTAGPNDNLWLPEATGMNTNGCDMPNDSNFALFLDNRGRMGTKRRLGDFVGMVILEIKITVFTCLLSSEGCDSFPKHLDLALAPNKTNTGVKKQ